MFETVKVGVNAFCGAEFEMRPDRTSVPPSNPPHTQHNCTRLYICISLPSIYYLSNGGYKSHSPSSSGYMTTN